ncbi:hypothetical protein [Cecembia rubra]|uniref:hypothetical protein n=1 Tax=Cecembia rubra TaxID=1485585 RepID=UPI0027145D1E|nr:hypothetical protein [Cecembia rubra]
MKKSLIYLFIIFNLFSCIDSEEAIIPKELVGKWEKDFNVEGDSWKVTFIFHSNGNYENFSTRTIQTEALQPGIMGYSLGNYSKREGRLVLSDIRSFYAEDLSNPPSQASLLKEQLEWIIPDEIAEFSLEQNNTLLMLTFLGCNDVLIPRSLANCLPPTPVTYTRVLE